MSTETINLNDYRDLFRNDQAFEQFAETLVSSQKRDFCPLICNETVIGAVLSDKGTKEYLYSRMAKRISERPELLGELMERIENDEIVE